MLDAPVTAGEPELLGRHPGYRGRSGAPLRPARAAHAVSGPRSRRRFGPVLRVDDATHLRIDLVERAEPVPRSLHLGSLKRGHERQTRFFLALQQAHSGREHLVHVPVAAARDRAGGKGFEM
jgi:hypothetical protein